jgi:hypothetical protein
VNIFARHVELVLGKKIEYLILSTYAHIHMHIHTYIHTHPFMNEMLCLNFFVFSLCMMLYA